jgi:peptide chain release factor 2
LNGISLKYGGVFDPDTKLNRIKELEEQTMKSDFWDNPEDSDKIFKEISSLKEDIEPWLELKSSIDEAKSYVELLEEEFDRATADELYKLVDRCERTYARLRISSLLSEPYDSSNVFLTIHSGAGGTEACDWVSMLLRMYLRWAEKRQFKVNVLDMLEAEGGVKSVTLEIDGKNAFGYLKGESGVHRLVRISPFDSNKRRHTSFASIYVSPVIDDDIEVDIKPEDIRIDTYRASGAGGQHVNTTDSAVRITHLASGIVVQCQNERSQIKNRSTAMKVLTSRLYEYYRMEQEAEQAKHATEKKDISWGNQIRSYVFQPYTMVKDHRTNFQIGNINAVMDGAIDELIEKYLLWRQE